MLEQLSYWQGQFFEKRLLEFLMTRTQLNIEYEKVMLEADKAVGRKEAMSLFKKARSIKKKILQDMAASL